MNSPLDLSYRLRPFSWPSISIVTYDTLFGCFVLKLNEKVPKGPLNFVAALVRMKSLLDVLSPNFFASLPLLSSTCFSSAAISPPPPPCLDVFPQSFWIVSLHSATRNFFSCEKEKETSWNWKGPFMTFPGRTIGAGLRIPNPWSPSLHTPRLPGHVSQVFSSHRRCHPQLSHRRHRHLQLGLCSLRGTQVIFQVPRTERRYAGLTRLRFSSSSSCCCLQQSAIIRVSLSYGLRLWRWRRPTLLCFRILK